MFNSLWSVLGNVTDSNVTKVWRLFVLFALLLSYTAMVSLATWCFSDTRDIRMDYLRKQEFDRECNVLRATFREHIVDMREHILDIKKSVSAVDANSKELRNLLLAKLLHDHPTKKQLEYLDDLSSNHEIDHLDELVKQNAKKKRRGEVKNNE